MHANISTELPVSHSATAISDSLASLLPSAYGAQFVSIDMNGGAELLAARLLLSAVKMSSINAYYQWLLFRI